MKNIAYKLGIMATVLLFATLCGCKSDDIIYDHELPQFDTRSDAYLIELIAPTGTSVDEELFIYGAFNGENDSTVLNNVKWKLEKAQDSDKKWGIYLFPSDFAEGKTLADGFSFVSVKSGEERDLKGNTVTHRLDNAKLGSRNNIWVERWASYFADAGKIKHNGPVIYVLDESGFSNLCLYLYGDIDHLVGTWPGLKQTGTETIDGVEFAYFDLGEDNVGYNETLIFSDNGKDQLADYGPLYLEGTIFLHITKDGQVEEYSADAKGPQTEGQEDTQDGARVYVLDGIGWGMSTTLYLYGDVNGLNGSWPGMKVKGTKTIGDYVYLYFDFGEANAGLKEYLIFSQSGKDQISETGYGPVTIEDDIYLYITTTEVESIADPENPQIDSWFNPALEEATIEIYLYNTTEEFEATHIYAYGTAEILGVWPGLAFADMEEISVFGLKLYHTTINCNKKDVFNLIVSDGVGKNAGGAELDAYSIVADEKENEIALRINDDKLTTLEVTAKIRRK